jgi:hypothetical protein
MRYLILTREEERLISVAHFCRICCPWSWMQPHNAIRDKLKATRYVDGWWDASGYGGPDRRGAWN